MTSLPELAGAAQARTRGRIEDHEVHPLSEGWQVAATSPGGCSHPDDLSAATWWPARVPGTAAAALQDAGAWQPGDAYDFDAEDWWFRTSFDAAPAGADEQVVLCLDGIATVADVYLNGQRVLDSESMFATHELDVGVLLASTNELAIHCRALAPMLSARRRPRARWRTRLVANGLRFFRTMLLGRAPGVAPGPAAVGPWRGVRLERRRHVVVDQLQLRASLAGTEGELSVRGRLRSLGDSEVVSVAVELSRGDDSLRGALSLTPTDGAIEVRGRLQVPDAALWWPHTHGEPSLYNASLIVSLATRSITVDAGRVGFRSLQFGDGDEHDVEVDGVDLRVNGVPVFARGCVWTPVDAVGLAPSAKSLRSALEQVRDGGMNLLRIAGTSAYEDDAFHDLCDELGVLVWQDFMFANLDYPISDPAFHAAVTREARAVLARLAGRPSLAVLCGNSEVEQQVAMLGLDASLGRGELFGELLPSLVRESCTDALYVPSAPCGGDLPFRTDRGISNYYGVGGYRRPLEDARRAEVRFAAECLAFSNVPDETAIERMHPGAPGDLVVHHPRWKAGVPRDAASGWDFEDVRDHYLQRLFEIEPAELRRVDHERYLELSRAVTGEVMAETLGEWRRAASPCSGALVLWLRDLAPGAGWGVLDDRGEPKVAYHHLRRALAPVAVWTTDEGLGGVLAHVANDRPAPLTAWLRVALYRDFGHRVDEAEQLIELPAHSTRHWDLEALLGRFVDAAWAYRFGPAPHDLIVASLESAGKPAPGRGEGRPDRAILSQSMRFPAGRPLATESPARLGLAASLHDDEGAAMRLSVRSDRFAYGVRVHVPGFRAADDAFSVEPGGERSTLLLRRQDDAVYAGGWLTAINLAGRIKLSAQQPRIPSTSAEAGCPVLDTAPEGPST
jgi:beta-mannosidase